MLTAGPRRESGFTLPELIIAITILGLIVGGLTFTLVGAIRVNSTTYQRTDAARDAQLTSIYFQTDTQAADTGAAGMATSGTSNCNLLGGETLAVQFKNTSFDNASPPASVVTYTVYARSASTYAGQTSVRLRRITCLSGNPAPTSNIVVVRQAQGVAASVSPAAGIATITLTGFDGSTSTITGSRRTS